MRQRQTLGNIGSRYKVHERCIAQDTSRPELGCGRTFVVGVAHSAGRACAIYVMTCYGTQLMTADFKNITTISFDCYGTLIDWEAGLLPVLRALLSRHGESLPDAAILELYGEYEAQAESGPYQSYRSVLQSVVRGFADRFHFNATAAEIRSLHESVPDWLPFPDTVSALRDLQRHYKLAVISNIDDNLFAQTRRHLEVDFDAVTTAEGVRNYKPSLINFRMALGNLGVSPDQLLHAGQSIYHDVVPARALGISAVWVNRKSARPGIGAVRESQSGISPDLEVPDLASLTAVLRRARQ
ncbi:MAG: haloacid dehalogenase type II [Terriglobales bacterium]